MDEEEYESRYSDRREFAENEYLMRGDFDENEYFTSEFAESEYCNDCKHNHKKNIDHYYSEELKECVFYCEECMKYHLQYYIFCKWCCECFYPKLIHCNACNKHHPRIYNSVYTDNCCYCNIVLDNDIKSFVICDNRHRICESCFKS